MAEIFRMGTNYIFYRIVDQLILVMPPYQVFINLKHVLFLVLVQVHQILHSQSLQLFLQEHSISAGFHLIHKMQELIIKCSRVYHIHVGLSNEYPKLIHNYLLISLKTSYSPVDSMISITTLYKAEPTKVTKYSYPAQIHVVIHSGK